LANADLDSNSFAIPFFRISDPLPRTPLQVFKKEKAPVLFRRSITAKETGAFLFISM